MALLPLLFLLPIVEMYLLIKVGGYLGAGATVIIVVGTAILGLRALRQQGPRTLLQVQSRLAAGELPVRELAESALLALAGVLLLMPGILSDLTGLVLLVPACRALAAAGVSRRFAGSGGRMPFGAHRPADAGRPGERDDGHGLTIEGEYERRPEGSEGDPCRH